MLRGAQTPGELKQRTERMYAFAELTEIHATLERLITRELVTRLDRRPGQKEERYAQLLDESGEEPAGAPLAQAAAQAAASPLADRVPAPVTTLEERVARLEREVAELRATMGNGLAHRPVAHGIGEP